MEQGIRELFDQAVGLDKEARAEWLSKACAKDERLRASVYKLLSAADLDQKLIQAAIAQAFSDLES